MDRRDGGFGGELRRGREAAGYSQAAFARLIHYSKGYLSKVETGRAAGNRQFAEACDRVLQAEGALAALMPEKPDRRSRRATVTPLVGLPPSTLHFTGRTYELAAAVSVLSGERAEGTCVLSGMAGVGKTALALRAAWESAESFPDGCLFLDLGDHAADGVTAGAEDVLDPLLRMLGVPGERIPSHPDGRANLYRGWLRGRSCLLVLDNAISAAQVGPVLPTEPRCRVIITSRNRLNALDDAVHVPMDVLPMAEAVTLFRAVGGDHAAAARGDLVERIVASCGGLPLAIRIAAARFRTDPASSLDDFAQRFADETARLGVLNDGDRSVAAAFSLSVGALPPEQLRVFALLAMHPGREVEIHDVAALADLEPAQAQALVDRLDDAHLVARGHVDHVSMHDLLRDFARSTILPATDPAEQDAAVRRLLDHSLLLARSADELLAPHRYRMPIDPGHLPAGSRSFPDRASALAWTDREWPSLVGLCRLAAARGFHGRCWQLAFLLRDFFFHAKLWDPWIETHRLAVTSARAEGDDRALAMTLNNLGIAYVDRGDLSVAIGYYEEALELFGELGDEHGHTNTMSNLAWAALYTGDHERALHGLEDALTAYRRMGNSRNAAIALRGVALVETELGHYADAVEHAELSYTEFVALGSSLDTTMSVNCVAWALFRSGDHDAAAAHYERAAELGEECGSRYETARALTGLGNVHAASGRPDAARRCWERADDLRDVLDPRMVGEARVRASW
ncbi:ATP-binding protein [Amycolatopsis aidingensis]|uniref:ATP-binding protein n=1 Tax=Amycolatopsis aidingensis TaxID=2842453 RepID=UPI001C0AF861|nr:XRE family transcriptional regulator [Amycolatopsis aidingensis]